MSNVISGENSNLRPFDELELTNNKRLLAIGYVVEKKLAENSALVILRKFPPVLDNLEIFKVLVDGL